MFISPDGTRFRNDLTGMKFGKLTAIRCVGSIKGHCGVWLCCCECGNTKSVRADRLKSGNTKSCGCINTRIPATHGLSRHPLYSVWSNMIARCSRKTSGSYMTYGGRGISVCKRWMESVAAFIEDMGPRPTRNHTLDRIDTDGDYCKENCRWASWSEQQSNRRNNRMLTHNGETMTLQAWSRKAGMSQSCLWKRLNEGMTVSEAISTPLDVSQQTRRKGKRMQDVNQ